MGNTLCGLFRYIINQVAFIFQSEQLAGQEKCIQSEVYTTINRMKVGLLVKLGGIRFRIVKRLSYFMEFNTMKCGSS